MTSSVVTVFPSALGPFALSAQIGEGGTSLVYAATRDGRELALKVLRPELGLDAREAARFVDEARRMHELRHPCLVEVIDAGVLPDGRPYIAMPRLRGRALAQRIHDLGRLSVPHALALFEGLTGAISILHRAGLVHRDIKPENVLWLEPPEERLVLLDLGIAREIGSGPSTTTQAGFARGTPAYMAPERFFGQPATVASDVYETAVVFYVAVVGRLPWDPSDPQARMSPAPASSHGVQLPAALEQVLLTAMSATGAERPRSVDELYARLAEAWRRWMESPHSDPAVVMAPTEVQRAGHSLSPERGGSTLPSAVHGGSPSATTALAAAGTARPPTASGPSGGALAIGAGIALVAALAGAGAVVFVREGGRSSARDEAVDDEDDDRAKKKRKKRADDAQVASSEPSASAAPEAAVSASASASATARPAPRAPVGPAPASSAGAAAQGPMPASCAALIALMCSPTSGARPEECLAWKGNVQRWNATMPPAQAAEVCQSAYQSSAKGLEHRRDAMSPNKP